MSTRRTINVRFRLGQLAAIIDALRLTKYDQYVNGRTALKRCLAAERELQARVKS